MATGLNQRDDQWEMRVAGLADSLSDAGLEAAVDRLAELWKRRCDARGYANQIKWQADRQLDTPSRSAMNEAEKLAWVFQYHDNPSKRPRYLAIRTAAKYYAEVILANVDPCPDRTGSSTQYPTVGDVGQCCTSVGRGELIAMQEQLPFLIFLVTLNTIWTGLLLWSTMRIRQWIERRDRAEKL